MYYDTQLIYRSEDNTKSFTMNGNIYYRTEKTRKPKMQDREGKLHSITEKEFKSQQDKFNFLFVKK